MSAKCMKHPWMLATRALERGGDRFWMCADCAWAALKAGERLLCPETGQHVRLDGDDKPVFDEKGASDERG